MSEESHGRRQRFQLLLQQLKLTEDAVVRHFEGAEIAKLTVERQTKRWHFSFVTETIIPCQLLKTFANALDFALKRSRTCRFQ